MVQQTLDGAATTSRKRNSYSREEKLRVIKWYGENGKNLYQTCKHFALNSKTVIRWLQGAETIRKSRKGSKRVKFTRKAHYPEMEESLYREYKELRYVQVVVWFSQFHYLV